MRRLWTALVLLAGCTPPPPPAVTDAPRHPSGPLRLLALGDSYTIGEGVAEADRWPVQLAAALRPSGLEVAGPEIVAATGWTTDELDAGIDRASPEGPYALVTLLIGVNDQYRGRPLDAYRQQVRGLLGRAVGFAGGEARRVVVVSIPDWGATPFAEGRDRAQIASEIDAFNAVAREEADRAGARWVDVTTLSRAQGDQTTHDGLHPNASAYTGWVRLISPHARAALSAP